MNRLIPVNHAGDECEFFQVQLSAIVQLATQVMTVSHAFRKLLTFIVLTILLKPSYCWSASSGGGILIQCVGLDYANENLL